MACLSSINNTSQVQESFTYMCWMFFLLMKSSTLPFLTVRVLLQSIEHTVWKLEVKCCTANITSSKTWWELQKKQDEKCENVFINRCTATARKMDATNWLLLTSKAKRNYDLNSLPTFSIIFTLRRPQTVESCLVIISFFLPGDCLGGALDGAGGSVEIL